MEPETIVEYCGGFSFSEHGLQGVGFNSHVHGFSCPSACGILQGLNPCSLHCRRIFKPLDHQEVPPSNIWRRKLRLSDVGSLG